MPATTHSDLCRNGESKPNNMIIKTVNLAIPVIDFDDKISLEKHKQGITFYHSDFTKLLYQTTNFGAKNIMHYGVFLAYNNAHHAFSLAITPYITHFNMTRKQFDQIIDELVEIKFIKILEPFDKNADTDHIDIQLLFALSTYSENK